MKNLPMNRWVALDSLTPEQIQAVLDGPVKCEWNTCCRNGRELIEVKINPNPKS